MKKSVCIETIFTEVPFEARFRVAREAGFDYVEFWSWDDKNIEAIKRLIMKNDLKIASFSGDKSYSMVDLNESSQYIAFIKESIKTAKYLGCEHLVLHSNALGEGGAVTNAYREISDDVKFAAMFGVLEKLAPLAEAAQIKLVLEALNTAVDHAGNFLKHTEDAVKLVEMVNSPYVQVLYDIYHMQIMEGNIIDNLNKYIHSIGYIHIADVPGRREPGTGEINYTNIMPALKSLNYSGVVGFELFPSQNSKAIAEQLIRL